MFISRLHGLKLVRDGQAQEDGLTQNDRDQYYVILTRYDLQRVDHYPATDEDLDRLTN